MTDEDGVVVEEDGAGDVMLSVDPADARHQLGIPLVSVSGKEAKNRLDILACYL